MKLFTSLFLMLTLPAFACDDPLYGMQIAETPEFQAQLTKLQTEGKSCRTISDEEGDVAMDIAFTSKDEQRRSGTVTRDFTAFLLCSRSDSDGEFLYRQWGRATYRFEYQDQDGTSCDGVTFRILKRTTF